MARFRKVLGRIARGGAAWAKAWRSGCGVVPSGFAFARIALSYFARDAVALAVLVLCFSFVAPAAVSQTSQSAAERELFDLANRERADRNLPALRWDNALAEAARVHARRMAEEGTLSHQFPGEASVGDRAHRAGASYTVIAENVAEGPSAAAIHSGWMHSPPHRANLLDPELSGVGIAIVRAGQILFAVQDFSHAVANLSLSEQEKEVAALIAAQGAKQGLKVSAGDGEARKACAATGERGGASSTATSWTVIRYEGGDLSKLPESLTAQLGSGRYRIAAVGACAPGSSGSFTHYRVAVLLR